MPRTVPQSTARPELDKTLEKLRAHATDWARSPLSERIALARKMLDGYVAVAEASVLAGCHAKGIDPNSTLAGRGVAGGADDRRAQPAPAHRDDGAACRRGGRRSTRRACARGRMGASSSRCFPAAASTRCLRRLHRRSVDAAGHQGAGSDRPRRGALSRAGREARRQGVARARRRQRGVDSRRRTPSTRCSSRARSASSR